MQEIITIARKQHIPFRVGLSKTDLIRAIQTKEGYTPCFRREDSCEEKECLWMNDCLPSKQRL